MSDSQFAGLLDWFGECVGAAFSFVGSNFDMMNRTAWFALMILAVTIGFLCLRGMSADQRM